MIESNEDLGSPFFSPEYSIAIDNFVDGVRIGVLEKEGIPLAFLPFEVAPGKIGKRLHWCDYQGVIAKPGFQMDMMNLVKGCGLRAWDFDHLLVAGKVLEPDHHSTAVSPIVEISDGFEKYLTGRSKESLSQIKEGEKKLRRIEKEFGQVDFRVHEDSPDVLEQMLRWRWGRYPDVRHSFDTVNAAMRSLLKIQSKGLRGTLTTLSAGGDLLAVHFGLRSATTWHHWLPSFNPEFQKFSPGIVRDLLMIKAVPEIGMKVLDFGKGDQQYKRNFATGDRVVAEGSVDVDPVLRGVRCSRRMAREWLRKHPILEQPAREAAVFVKRVLGA